MTSSAPTAGLTVAVFRGLLEEWPRIDPEGRPTAVYLADRFPDLSHGPRPAVSIGMLEEHGLVLFPEQQDLPKPQAGTKADALDLCLEAIQYQLFTPFLDYDPDKANALFVRAVTAIETIRHLEKGLGI